MQQENKSKPWAILFTILSVMCMIAIFYFSAQTADESAEQSLSILEIIRKILGDNSFSDFIVRKAAHFCEFTLLGLLFNFTYYFCKGKQNIILSTSLASIYAVSDEIHQIFVDGRACQFRDWVVDTSGAITGMLVFMLICAIINKVKKSKEIKNEYTHI